MTAQQETEKSTFGSQIPSHYQRNGITQRWVRECSLQRTCRRQVGAEYSALLRAQLLRFISTVQTKSLKPDMIHAGFTALSLLCNFSDWFLTSCSWGHQVWRTPHISRPLLRCTVAEVPDRSRRVGPETPKPLGRKMDANKSFSQHRWGSEKTGPH